MCERNRTAVNRCAVTLGALAVFSAASHAQADVHPEDAARDVVTRFERALQDHDEPAIAALVADDIVVTELFANPAKPHRVTHVLWSVYVLEPRQVGWRIVSLDWSIAKQR